MLGIFFWWGGGLTPGFPKVWGDFHRVKTGRVSLESISKASVSKGEVLLIIDWNHIGILKTHLYNYYTELAIM